ncbi:MAG: acyl-CoA dehydrogenase family protein [Gemmatimonadaceae bacterium]
MDFSWSPDQIELRDAVAEFARTALSDDLIRRDKHSEFSRDLWNRCAQFGIQGLPIPEEYGGRGCDTLTTVLALEALGYGCRDNGLLFGISAQMWSVQMPILLTGSEPQKTKYLPGLCDGTRIGAHAMSEPSAGSDAFGLRTTAERRGDRYVLNGSKTFVSNAPVADVFVVFASVDLAKGSLGLTAFLVDRDTPGLSVSRPIGKMGLTTSPMAELFFDDCEVALENRLGREGRGASLFNDSMEWERSCILAAFLGTMQRQLETCVRYAKERHQFGKPIGEFQSVSNRLVQMKVRLETSRLQLYHAAWTKQQGGPAGTAAAIAKLFISEASLQSALDAVQVHGGYGFTTEYEVERELRDAVGGRLYSGTSEIQAAIIARNLGL